MVPVPPQGNFFVQSKPRVSLAALHLGPNFQPLWLIIQGDLADDNHVSNYLLRSREEENSWLQRPLCFPEKLSWLQKGGVASGEPESKVGGRDCLCQEPRS